jgi:valyl-tRNA synthetase
MTETEIANRFDFATAAPRLYAGWESAGCFTADAHSTKPPFCIVIPPPNVTGALHLGHALNGTLQDIMIRWRRMQGYEALWVPGTDHAGIATQAVVERRLKEQENITRHELGREGLVARIWTWKEQYEARILAQLRRLGVSCDWSRTRFTLDEVCTRAVRATFFNLFQRRLIYRGKRLVNWDTFLQTAVSDDEVFHETVAGSFWHLRYPVIDPLPGEPSVLVVATTRPETMLGDTAVAVHPDPAGALAAVALELEGRLKSASAKERAPLQAQLDDLEKRRQELLPQLEQLAAMARDGRQVMLPLAERPIPLVTDTWAKPELGSGCVKITPAHDPNDYEVARRCNLPMLNILQPDGRLNEQAGNYRGLTIAQARTRVVADLEARGLLESIEQREIELAHSDRSKTPIEPYLADQWFVRMDQLAQSAIDAVVDERVRIYPDRYRRGYIDWLSEKRDWPVSRQLWWGHRIPIWSRRCASPQAAEQLADQLSQHPAARADRLAVQTDGEQTVYACPREADPDLEAWLDSQQLIQDSDVLDTWFSSALWPHSTLGWPEQTPELEKFYPTSTLITSRDILTLWVARMVLMGLSNVGDVPFREVFIHPKILDAFGETMSKSKGNGVDPLDVIEKFGPDALRFGLAWLATETQDVRLPVQYECPHCHKLIDQTRQNRQQPQLACPACHAPFSTQWAESESDRALPRAAVVSERFEFGRNFGNKLWNAARFALLNLADYRATPLHVEQLPVEDRWLLSRLHTVTAQVTDALDHYHFADAARLIYDFAWDEFCSFYVEMAKPRLQQTEQRAQTQQVLAHALDQVLRLLHPLMPFVTEEIWQALQQAAPRRGLEAPQPQSAFLMQAAWPAPLAAHHAPAIEKQYAVFQAVLGAVREIRSRQNIAPRELVPFSIRCSPATANILAPMNPYFRALANAECTAGGAEVQPPTTHAHVSLPAHELDVYVDLERFIDVQAELERNQKLLEKLAKQIQGKANQLNNQSFVARAPAEVVERERQSLAELERQRDAVSAAITALAGRASG